MLSVAVTPVEAESPVESNTPDIGVINNSDQKLPITVRIYPEDYREQSLFEGTWELKGRNQRNLEDVSEVYFRGNIEIAGSVVNTNPGEFVVDAQVPSGASDTVPVFVGHNGFPSDQTVSVYANSTDEVKVLRAL